MGLSTTESLPTLADIPATETVIEAGEPIATVLDDAERADQVAERLRGRAAALQASCAAV
jgi:predicted ATP-grasp superfamily ATP-dependent carboligase